VQVFDDVHIQGEEGTALNANKEISGREIGARERREKVWGSKDCFPETPFCILLCSWDPWSFPSLLRLFELGSIMGEFSNYTSSRDRNSACQFKCMTLTSIL
jgi:hypothetical protein